MEKTAASTRTASASRTLPSPARLLTVLVGATFSIELAIMIGFNQFPKLPDWLEIVLDASLLSLLLFPALYYLVFRPLTTLLERHGLQLRQHDEENALAAYMMDHYRNSEHEDPRAEYLSFSASHHFSGDAISVFRLPDGGLNIMVADAMGHGLPAAINALPAIQAFYSMSGKGMPLRLIIPEINDKLHRLLPPGQFLACSFLHLNSANSELNGWIGGMPPVYVKNNGGIKMFRSRNLALGILPSSNLAMEFFSVPWDEQAMLVTCTDGILESGETGETETAERWIYDILQMYGNTLDRAIFDRAWKYNLGGSRPLDDASVLIVNQARVATTA